MSAENQDSLKKDFEQVQLSTNDENPLAEMKQMTFQLAQQMQSMQDLLMDKFTKLKKKNKELF